MSVMAVAHSRSEAPVHSKATPLSNVVEIVAMLLIPLAFIGAFSSDDRQHRTGLGIFVAIAVSFVVGTDALMGCVVALGSVACVNGPSMFVVRASRCRKGAGQPAPRRVIVE